jgi:protein SCO1
MGMNWRLASRLSVVVCAVLVVLVIALVQRSPAPASIPNTNSTGSNSSASGLQNNSATSGLQGTDLGSTPAPNFSLTDQFGKQVSLSGMKGKPVILTFLYTHCPDICPLTAEKLHTALQGLGQQAQQVGVIAVSTDPKGDNVAAALSFSQAHNMQNYWHYLVGSQSQLSPVWSGYHIYAQAGQQVMTVNHSTGIFILDKQGNERIFLGDDFTPAQVTANLNTLLKQ